MASNPSLGAKLPALRAAFRKYSRIQVDQSGEGLSGSDVLFVYPYDCAGQPVRPFVSKFYAERRTAEGETENYFRYVKEELPHGSHAQPDHRRNIFSRSPFVVSTPLIAFGNPPQIMTLRGLLGSQALTRTQFSDALDRVFAILDVWWRKATMIQTSLAKSYLNSVRPERQPIWAQDLRTTRLSTVEIGNPARKLDQVFQDQNVYATVDSISHGDLHGGNIVFHGTAANLQPVLINFAVTGPHHGAKDLVFLMVDLLRRLS